MSDKKHIIVREDTKELFDAVHNETGGTQDECVRDLVKLYHQEVSDYNGPLAKFPEYTDRDD